MCSISKGGRLVTCSMGGLVMCSISKGGVLVCVMLLRREY